KKEIKMATAKTMAKAGSKKSIGIKAVNKLTGSTNFQSAARVTNMENNKLEIQNSAATVISCIRLLIDKEKIKS
ncbi:MAG: hypothetical protein Q8Q86_02550, partial [Candidatus Daviesbacteria bacterium]|nr:hypothetical protein [Candidatus Daviesbacteria bacterium]